MFSLIEILIYFFLFCIGIEGNQYFLKREHSLTVPYGANWDFYGNTLLTSSYVRLTAAVQSQHGGIYNTQPLLIRDWEVHLNFKVHGSQGNLFGDGMVFWYTDKPLIAGPVFGNRDYFRGLAILLDTYSNHNGPHNHEHPYVSAMVNNGTLHYDHDRDGTHTQLAGCTCKFRNRDHDTLIAVRYSNEVLTVSTDVENKGSWEECFVVKGIRLPTGYYIGLSAATGDLNDNHDVLSLKTFELEVDHSREDSNIDWTKVEPYADNMGTLREHVDDPASPSVWWTIMKVIFYLVVICAAVALLLIGYQFYRSREEQKKRFY